MVSYHSTRSRASACASKRAVLAGIAPDGGLFVSDELGDDRIELADLANKGYLELARDVLGVLLPDFSAGELAACVEEAYTATFSDPEITPLVRLETGSGAEASGDGAPLYVLELFGGPTSAFKDVALQMLPRLMARAASTGSSPSPERIMIVAATSGDTGKAALAGFADAPGTGCAVFYPEGQVSRVQNLQMSTQTGENVAVCGVRGNFDDTQAAVKRIFADRALAARLRHARTALSSANSINVGRLAPQVVYYFAAYAQLLRRRAIAPGDAVEFCVPTGNFGNVLAGYYAQRLGLPISRLIVASDANNVLFDFLTTGVYDRRRTFLTTTSPSMDILVSSNLERMLYHLAGGDTGLVARLMADLADTGRYEVPPSLLAPIRSVFSAGWASEAEVRAAIRACWEAHGYLIDPHTACGYHVLARQRLAAGSAARVLLATASPYKFPRVVADALGASCPNDDFACMELLERLTGTVAPARLSELASKPVRFGDVIDVADMAAYVEKSAERLARAAGAPR